MVDFPLPCLINGGYNLVDFFSKRFAGFLRILQVFFHWFEDMVFGVRIHSISLGLGQHQVCPASQLFPGYGVTGHVIIHKIIHIHMYVYTYIYIYIYTYACACIYTHIYTHRCTDSNVYKDAD